MDIKDVKVGMTVQINNNGIHYVGYVGTVQSVDYINKVATLKLEGLNTPWTVFTYRFDEYQDPEADMVVWDALEVGEHFIRVDGEEAVKINKNQYVVLERAGIYTVIQSRIGQLTKYKLA